MFHPFLDMQQTNVTSELTPQALARAAR